jgi:hypothetical protein
MSEKILAFMAATGGLSKETAPEEAKSILRNARVLLLDMTPTELEDAFADLEERTPLPKKWLQALRREVKDLRKQPQAQPLSAVPTQQEELAALKPLAAPLASSPDILGEVVKVMRALGVAGQEREVKLIYLALTTRTQNRPVNVAVKGPSSGGKSFLVESTLSLFPDNAYYALSAMSEKALAYSQEPLSHRFLIIYEAAGLGSEFSQYLMRSLLSEGRVRYETVEKTTQGPKARLIEREGPTGFITTTTRVGFHPENETRLVSLEVDESPEQTRAVLLSQASQECKGSSPDLAPFHAFQRILEINKPEVVIPFARLLAQGCDPKAVRLRRDFRTLLALVKAHAALHSEHRQADFQGRIIADPADYAIVYHLVADLIAHGTGAKVDKKVRTLVSVVASLAGEDGVTLTKVAEAMGVHPSTALRTAKKALKESFLVNKESRPHTPARLVVGDPIPPDGVVLPLPGILHSYSPENGANVQSDRILPIILTGSRLQPILQTAAIGGEQGEGLHKEVGRVPDVCMTPANDNKLESHIENGSFAGVQGFSGDRGGDLFNEDDVEGVF